MRKDGWKGQATSELPFHRLARRFQTIVTCEVGRPKEAPLAAAEVAFAFEDCSEGGPCELGILGSPWIRRSAESEWDAVCPSKIGAVPQNRGMPLLRKRLRKRLCFTAHRPNWHCFQTVKR